MRIHILMIPADCECEYEPQPCPSCGKDIIINEDEMSIKHINPPCEWFQTHAMIANTLNQLAKKSCNKLAN